MISNHKYYKSDSIEKGRKIKAFFNDFCEQIFKDNEKYLKTHNEVYNYYDSPYLHKEKTCMPMMAVSLSKITDMFLPEPAFKTKNGTRRYIDLWCSYENISYFMEAKHGWYCLGSNSKNEPTTGTTSSFKTMQQQIQDIKHIEDAQDWEEHTVPMGIMVVVGYYKTKNQCSEEFTHKTMVDEFAKLITPEDGIQLLSNTYEFPKKVIKGFEENEDNTNSYKFITILGTVLTY